MVRLCQCAMAQYQFHVPCSMLIRSIQSDGIHPDAIIILEFRDFAADNAQLSTSVTNVA